MSSTNDGPKTPSTHSSRGSAVLVEGPSSTKGSTPVATPESGSGRRRLGHRSFLADSVSPRSASSRAGQTSALLERISRLQARLNERVSLAGLAHSSGPMQKRRTESDSLQEGLRTPREASAPHRDRIRELAKFNTPPSPSSVRSPAGRDELSARSALPHETESAPLSGHRAAEVQSTDQKSMHARALDLEHALHTSETANRKLRSSLTQMQESFATQSAELSRVGMKLDASRKVQDTLRAQLKMLEAERNEVHLSASFQGKIYELEKKLNDKERKIVKLEALLLSDSSSVRKTNVIESQGGAEGDRPPSDSDAAAHMMIHTLEATLLDIRDSILRTMGPRKHPPTASRNQPLDAAAVLAYKEEIIVEVLQRKSEADALEEELRTATSRQKKPSENGHKAGLGLSSDDSLDDRDEVDKTELEHGELLGKGSFAEVYKGWWRRPVAIKKFRNLARQEQLDSFGRETRILRMMNHVGIARFCGIHTDLPNLSFLLECVDGSSIHEICHADKERPLHEKEAMGLCLQLSEVMCYVHSRDVVHRDLKPTNVLVSSKGMVKLIDFGLAHQGDPSQIPKHSIMAGTPVYLPPEVLREECVSTALDVYSFGIIVWEMVSRALPFQGLTLKQMLAAVTQDNARPEIPLHCSPGMQAIIQSCWHADLHQRPSFEFVSARLKELGAPPAPSLPKAQFETMLAM